MLHGKGLSRSDPPACAPRWQGADDRQAELAAWRGLLKLSLWLTIPVFLTAMVFPWFPLLRPVLDAPILGFPFAEVVKWGFTTPVQFWIGARFHLGALKALRNGRHAMLWTAKASV